MKSFITLLFSLLTLISFAQESGKITYNITMESDDPEMQQAMAMMGGDMEMQVISFYSEDGFRSEMTNPFMSTTTISSSDSDEVLILMSGMMGKSAIKTAASDYRDSKGLKGKKGESIDIPFKDETKEILGYTCKKAIIDAGSKEEMVFWYTEEIAPKKLAPDMPQSLPGIPLEYSMKTQGMDMNFVVTDISFEPVDASMFNLDIPAGYKTMDLKALEKLGGMGF